MKKLIYILWLLVAIVACESVPSDVISKGQMEDILYEIHLSQNLESPLLSYEEKQLQEITLRKSILNKYGVSDAEWDSSMVYYCRHTDQLYDIYISLSERLRNNVIDAGGEVEMNLVAGADTSDVWTADKSIVLMQFPPYNVRSFSIKADSTYLPGDRVTLSFTPQFIYQDGMREVICVFAVTLKNDSVVNEVRHCNSSDMLTTLNMEDRGEIGIKDIRLYFMCTRTLSEDLGSTLRLAFVNNIKLIHTHPNKDGVAAQEEKIEVRQEKKDSSVVKSDSVIPVIEELPPMRGAARRPIGRKLLREEPVIIDTKRVR